MATVAKTMTELMWKHGARNTLMPVRTDKSEPTGLFQRGDSKRKELK